MNAQQLQGQWNEIKGKVKEKWGQLTDDDLQLGQGSIDQLVGRIQQKTGEGREKIEQFFRDLTARSSVGIAGAAEHVGHFAKQAGDQLRDQFDAASDRFNRGYEHTEELVRSNPAQSLAVAFGAGAVVGLLVGLTIRSSR